jgi:hypothetical protein
VRLEYGEDSAYLGWPELLGRSALCCIDTMACSRWAVCNGVPTRAGSGNLDSLDKWIFCLNAA